MRRAPCGRLWLLAAAGRRADRGRIAAALRARRDRPRFAAIGTEGAARLDSMPPAALRRRLAGRLRGEGGEPDSAALGLLRCAQAACRAWTDSRFAATRRNSGKKSAPRLEPTLGTPYARPAPWPSFMDVMMAEGWPLAPVNSAAFKHLNTAILGAARCRRAWQAGARLGIGKYRRGGGGPLAAPAMQARPARGRHPHAGRRAGPSFRLRPPQF